MVDEKVIKDNRNATPQFIAALTQVVWTQIGKMLAPPLFRPLSPLFPPLPPFSTSFLWLTRTQESVAQDLESFSAHAGRTTISTDDVLLLCRRNQDMHHIIKDFIDQEKAEKAAKGDKRSRR